MAYRILSLSGGGIRGIFQAVYLRNVAQALGKPLHECFDLIAGTSTGAIIALSLAFGVDPQKIVDLFKNDGPKIFRPRRFASIRKGPKYSQDPLRLALSSVLGGQQLGQAKRDVIVAAATLDPFRCRAFSNLHDPTDPHSDTHLMAVDIALASSAAPTYFPPAQPEGQERSYVDGGLWANDPLLLAIMYAQKYRGIPFQEIRIVNVGNGEVSGGELAKNFRTLRPISPRMITSVFEMMFATQAHIAREYAGFLIGTKSIFRVDTVLSEPIELDNVTLALDRLPAHAEDQASNTIDELKVFLGIAPPPSPPIVPELTGDAGGTPPLSPQSPLEFSPSPDRIYVGELQLPVQDFAVGSGLTLRHEATMGGLLNTPLTQSPLSSASATATSDVALGASSSALPGGGLPFDSMASQSMAAVDVGMPAPGAFLPGARLENVAASARRSRAVQPVGLPGAYGVALSPIAAPSLPAADPAALKILWNPDNPGDTTQPGSPSVI